MKGTFALQISRETVPDLETAKVDLLSICSVSYTHLTLPTILLV